MPEQFDFRKSEDQERFAKLPEDEKELEIDSSRIEATVINDFIRNGVVKNYEEAKKLEVITRKVFDLFSDYLKSHDKSLITGLEEKFSISGEQFQAIIETLFKISLTVGLSDVAILIKDNFSISEEKKRKTALLGLTERLLNRDVYEAIEIKNNFSISEEDLKSPEIQQAARLELIERFKRGDVDNVFEMKNIFNISPNIIKEIDEDANFLINDDNLIHFVIYFNHHDLISSFPATSKRIREMILDKLEKDLDLADYFLENSNYFYSEGNDYSSPWIQEGMRLAVSHYSVAEKFINEVKTKNQIWWNYPWVADVLAEAEDFVGQYDQNEDNESEGFRESDPFKNHPWLFDNRQAKISSGLSRLMRGKSSMQSLESLGMIPEYLLVILEEIESEIRVFVSPKSMVKYLDRLNIGKEDKDALLNPDALKVKMTPLLENIRPLVARFLVQHYEGDLQRMNEELGDKSWMEEMVDNGETNREKFLVELRKVINEGLVRFMKVLEIDIPLYDKLYEEFDNLRETGRYPLEVFLGRDGIYAWIGRRTQDVARRRKMGPEGRKKMRESGEIIEINPQYTVYPRYFRDNLDYATKRQFLEQEGISPNADPLFYDTGYTGTIPEQIMRIMEFDEEEIEKRIRLLSAPSVHRRVKGISENARHDIIEYIEHNAKTEETAEGLIFDEKTGKIRHIAKPTSPEEQFYFMMVKQAIARHYWLQEQLHHEPSGNVNLDSEHYTIRIRQDYAKALPQEFLHNPKEFFAQHGEILKGGKNEGEYPDEEIVLFKLDDGTEIVAKKIELRKSKEARKEFSILIAAKKAGLPTAEPVGFLSGKQDADGSYLLMKKIEGRSGRKIEKELRDSGKYSEDQIKKVMQQIVEKYKEMVSLFRSKLKIDKRWRIKDTIIEFNEETMEVGSVIPIDWERAEQYDSNNPKIIDELK